MNVGEITTSFSLLFSPTPVSEVVSVLEGVEVAPPPDAAEAVPMREISGDCGPELAQPLIPSS